MLEEPDEATMDLATSMTVIPRRVLASEPAKALQSIRQRRKDAEAELESLKATNDARSSTGNADDESERPPTDAKRAEIDELDEQATTKQEEYSSLFNYLSNDSIAISSWLDSLMQCADLVGADTGSFSTAAPMGLSAFSVHGADATHPYTASEKLLGALSQRWAKEKGGHELPLNARIVPIATGGSTELPEGTLEGADASLVQQVLDNAGTREEISHLTLEWIDPDDAKGFASAARELMSAGRVKALGAAGLNAKAVQSVHMDGVRLSSVELESAPSYLLSDDGSDTLEFCASRGIETRISDALMCGAISRDAFDILADYTKAQAVDKTLHAAIDHATVKMDGKLLLLLQTLSRIAEHRHMTLEAVYLSFLMRLGLNVLGIRVGVSTNGSTIQQPKEILSGAAADAVTADDADVIQKSLLHG